MDNKGITKQKQSDIIEWYEQVCLKSELADFGEVKGTIVIRPRGFYIWQEIQNHFNTIIQNEFNVDNCSFPMLIPERFFKKEAEHAQGFAPELAWIQTNAGEDAKDKVIIRPTSETIIVDSFAKWLRNYRQLPIKVNQWCNVLRWEVKQTKLFLRGREFLWQEGHCIYETNEECQKDVEGILNAYVRICKDVLALPVITGEKTPAERFPGAVKSYTIEGLMPDGKALQMGTSHNLGQGFMKGFNVEYMGRDEKTHNPYYNSWGFATRLIGALVMTHSDNKGLVLPPKVAKEKVVIIPIKKKGQSSDLQKYVEKIADSLQEFRPIIDDRDEYSMGWKLNEWELKGVPAIIIVGGFDMEKNVVTLKMRDEEQKKELAVDSLTKSIQTELDLLHTRLYNRAKTFLDSHIVHANTIEEFTEEIAKGKLVSVYFNCDVDVEKEVEETYGVGTRCIIDENAPPQKCLFSQNPTKKIVLFGKSY